MPVSSAGQAARKRRFLNKYYETLDMQKACVAARINRVTSWRWRDEDPEFERAIEKATLIGVEDAEANLFKLARRAREPSEEMIKFLLRSYKRSTYGTKIELDLKNDEQFQATLRAVAQVLREFVPKEFIDSALNRLFSLTGFSSGIVGRDGTTQSQITDSRIAEES